MNSATTVIDALAASLEKSAAFNSDDAVAPAAVLWPDEKREWEKLRPVLRARLPQLLVLGPYDSENRAGPAIWLRCVLAGTIAGEDAWQQVGNRPGVHGTEHSGRL